MRRTHRRAAALVIGTITLAAITGCAHTTADDTPEPTPAQTSATSTPATTSPTIGQAPDGTPIPGGKPTWLTNLPDPSTVDRTDPEAVIRAYVATAATWDTTVDKTSAYATQRAAIYLTDALRQAAADYDPDTAKGQAQFTQAAQHDSYTTVTIRQIVEEGLDPDQDGDVHRIVHYLVKTTPRDGSDAPDDVAWDAWVTATQENGEWAITSIQTQATQS